MTQKSPPPMLAPRPNEDDDEQMFREALERHGSKLLSTLDSAIELRAAAADTQRCRHLVRGSIVSALTQAMNTYYMHRLIGPVRAATPRSK